MTYRLVTVLAVGGLLLNPAREASAQPALIFEAPVPGNTRFGAAIATLGGNVIVGAPDAPGGGAAYLLDGTTRAVLLTLAPPVPTFFNEFGTAAAAAGANILVGEPGLMVGPDRAGAVRLVDGVTGALLQTYSNPAGVGDMFDDDDFGTAVATVGSNVLVGAPFQTQPPPGGGAAYLFDRASGALLLTLASPSPTAGEAFGHAVAALGGDLVVGAPSFTGVGAVYVLDGTTGALVQSIPDPNPIPSPHEFGWAVASSGGSVLVGAPREDVGAADAGSAYLFDGATGTLLHSFHNPAPSPNAFFGSSVAFAGGNVVVGSGNAAYLFDAATGTLLRTFVLPAPATAFGFAVGALGSSALAGAVDFAGGSGRCRVLLFCGGAAGCNPCETCGPLGTCASGPHVGCRHVSAPGRALLRVRNATSDTRDRLTWKWRGQGTTSASDFWQPTTANDYTLCLYDGASALTFRATAPAGGMCGTRPCWKATSGGRVGFLYADRDRTPEGVNRLRLVANENQGTEAATLVGIGVHLSDRPAGLPSLPLALPVRAQLQARDGWCFEAEYSSATVNGPEQFVAHSD